LTVFPFGRISVELLFNAVFKNIYLVMRSKLAFMGNLPKCNSDFDMSAAKNAKNAPHIIWQLQCQPQP